MNELFDGRVKLTLFLEDAAEVVTRNAVRWIELDGGLKGNTRLIGLAHLVEDYAQVDMRFDPIGRELDRAAVSLD